MAQLVVSNNGNWDDECLGVIGVVEEGQTFAEVVQKHGEFTEDEFDSKIELHGNEVWERLDDRELSCYYNGRNVMAYEFPGTYGCAIYILVELRS